MPRVTQNRNTFLYVVVFRVENLATANKIMLQHHLHCITCMFTVFCSYLLLTVSPCQRILSGDSDKVRMHFVTVKHVKSEINIEYS